jgi:hypothetical protein
MVTDYQLVLRRLFFSMFVSFFLSRFWHGCKTTASLAIHSGVDSLVSAEGEKAAVTKFPLGHEFDSQDCPYSR